MYANIYHTYESTYVKHVCIIDVKYFLAIIRNLICMTYYETPYNASS